MEGLFVTFEGLEGGGKTTAVERVSTKLRSEGFPVVQTKVLGGTEFSQDISSQLVAIVHELLSTSYIGSDTLPDIFVDLWFQALASVTNEVIKPALETSHLVLCDRFSDSALAIIGHGAKRDFNIVQSKIQHSTGGLTPDITFLFDLPLEVGLSRKNYRYDSQTLAFYRDMGRGYSVMFDHDQNKRWRKIDAAQAIVQVDADVYRVILEEILAKRIEK